MTVVNFTDGEEFTCNGADDRANCPCHRLDQGNNIGLKVVVNFTDSRRTLGMKDQRRHGKLQVSHENGIDKYAAYPADGVVSEAAAE